MYIFKKFKALICIALFFSLGSCDDFLTENPRGEQPVGQFFQTVEEARSFINRLYRVGAGADFYDSINSLEQDPAGLSNMMTGYYRAAEERASISNITRLTLGPEVSNESFTGLWESLYDAVSQANIAIQQLSDNERIPEDRRLTMLSEARFFRALNYFELVKLWGDVPLVIEPPQSVGEDIFKPRTDAAQIYNQVFEDLNWVIDQGNLPEQTTFPGNSFQLVEDVALTVLADAALQSAGFPEQIEENYSIAADAAREVIQKSVHGLVEHGPNVMANPVEESAYNIMRTSDFEREFIYSIEFDNVIAPNGHANIAIPRDEGPSQQVAFNNTFNKYRPREPFIAMYDQEDDLRIQNQQFIYDSFEFGGEEFQLSNPAPWWYFEEEALFNTGRGTQDFKAYRFAEVLLIAAEAIARTEGVTSEAVGYLADVRDRALYTTDRSVIVNELSSLSEQEFVEEVWKEKLRELPYDMKLWEDIQRTRLYPTPSETTEGEIEFIDIVGATTPSGVTFREFQLLFPIAQDIIEKNSELVQNPGYPTP